MAEKPGTILFGSESDWYEMSYETKVYKEQGGNRQTIVPGGSMKVGNVVFTVNAAGLVIVTGIPTANPNVAGALYSNSGVLTLSAG